MRYLGWLATVILFFSTTACTPEQTRLDEPSGTQAQHQAPAPLTAELKQDSIRRAANRVADWQLRQYDLTLNNFREEERASELPQGWVNATFNIGLLHWAEVSDQRKYRRAVKSLSEVNQWQLGPRPYNADDQAMGQVYLDLYQIYEEPRMLEPTKKILDWVLANPSDATLVFDKSQKEKIVAGERVFHDPVCKQRWCWADAIFMAPPVFFELSRITGDDKYAEFVNREFWETTDYLYREEQSLYLRDSRYFDQQDAQGNLIYWGRGNGWVLAGLARMLEQMPADFEQRAAYEKIYLDMAARLVELQQADGNWRSSLLDQEAEPVPESSGTGLLVFALAWGLNNNLLEGDAYSNSVRKGWQALINAVHPNGKLGWVQQVAYAPGSATYDDTQLYGVGAFLLAAAELYQLEQPKHLLNHQ
jgi:unsaturated rhamnogalacturonyl hydrolase